MSRKCRPGIGRVRYSRKSSAKSGRLGKRFGGTPLSSKGKCSVGTCVKAQLSSDSKKPVCRKSSSF